MIFVHAADLHLDTPFETLGRMRPDLQHKLADASLDAFDRLIDLAIARRAGFLLLAGDIYDGPARGLRAQFRVLRGFERLNERGIRIFLVHGNHDPLGGWTAVRAWPGNVKIFGSSSVETVELPGAVIHGISYARAESPNLAPLFSRPDDGRFHIGLLHCDARGEQGTYSNCSLADLERGAMNYWALGHIHERRAVQVGRSWVVYPGCLQARSFKASEHGIKGAYVVEAANDGIREPEFVSLDSARFYDVPVDIAAIPDIAALSSALRASADALRQQNPDAALLLRARITGRGPVHGDLLRDGITGNLLEELRREHESAEPFIWWAGVLQETVAPVDRESILARGDFSADLISMAERLSVSPEALLELAASSWSRGRAVLNAVDNERFEPATLLAEAEELALHMLEPEGRA